MSGSNLATSAASCWAYVQYRLADALARRSIRVWAARPPWHSGRCRRRPPSAAHGWWRGSGGPSAASTTAVGQRHRRHAAPAELCSGVAKRSDMRVAHCGTDRASQRVGRSKATQRATTQETTRWQSWQRVAAATGMPVPTSAALLRRAWGLCRCQRRGSNDACAGCTTRGGGGNNGGTAMALSDGACTTCGNYLSGATPATPCEAAAKAVRTPRWKEWRWQVVCPEIAGYKLARTPGRRKWGGCQASRWRGGRDNAGWRHRCYTDFATGSRRSGPISPKRRPAPLRGRRWWPGRKAVLQCQAGRCAGRAGRWRIRLPLHAWPTALPLRPPLRACC